MAADHRGARTEHAADHRLHGAGDELTGAPLLAQGRSLTPKLTDISEKIGGLPSLTAVLVMVTGVIGVISAKHVLNFLKIGDHAARGFSIGLAAHGMGIARAFQVSEEAGAFVGVAMALTALASSILFPLLLWVFTS